MGRFVGIDGFRWGWVAASIDGRGTQRFDYAPSLERLLREPYERAMVDMTIGLPTIARRRCDDEARIQLGPSVFTGVRRSLLDFASHSEANAHYREVREPRVSIQLWSIAEKIRELDTLKTSGLAIDLHETHPELVFRWLNKGLAFVGQKILGG